jgi:hypothetical protein
MSSRLSGRRSSHPLDSHQAGCVSLKQYFEGDQWQGSTTRIDREDGGCADKRPECRFHDCKEPGLIKAFIGRLRGRMGWLGRRSWTRLERPVCRAASETSSLKRCAELGLLVQKETHKWKGIILCLRFWCSLVV